MSATPIPVTDSAGKWSQTGGALTMTALDNANGNTIALTENMIVIAQNTSGGPLTIQFSSQPLQTSLGAGRKGDISQSLAANEIRHFQFTKNGWADGSGNLVMPSGQSASLKVCALNLL